MSATPDTGRLEKDLPLRDDIRLLGRVLGDTLRVQEGDALFQLVESVRQTAVRFAREGSPDDRAELHRLLDGLPHGDMHRVVRAFAHFLQLANIAERFLAADHARQVAFLGEVKLVLIGLATLLIAWRLPRFLRDLGRELSGEKS